MKKSHCELIVLCFMGHPKSREQDEFTQAIVVIQQRILAFPLSTYQYRFLVSLEFNRIQLIYILFIFLRERMYKFFLFNCK